MKYTDKLGLPIWDKPETDTFDIGDFNKGMQLIDDTVVNIFKKIEEVNKISSQLDNIANYNVKHLGAKGNANYYNSTDGYYYEDREFTKKATDDTSILQNIIDIVGENGGGTINFPRGNYLISLKNNEPNTLEEAKKLGCLIIKYDNINLVGEDGAQLIQVGKNLKKLTDDYSTFINNGVEYFYRGHSILIGNEQYPKIKNTLIKNLILNGTCEPITLGKSSSWTNKTDNLISWDTTHKSIYYNNKKGYLIDGLTIENCHFIGYRGEVIYGGGNNANNIFIKNNIIEKSVTGLSCEGDMIIENNTIKDISTNAIEINPTRNMIIKNNNIIHCFNGIVIPYYKNGYVPPIIQISDNTFIDCQKTGLSISGVSNVMAKKNTFIDCGVLAGYFDDTTIKSNIGQCALLFKLLYNEKVSKNCIIEDNTFIIDNKKLSTPISISIDKTVDHESFLTNIFKNNSFKRSDNAITNNFYFNQLLNINNQMNKNLSNIYNNIAKLGDVAYEYSSNVFTTRCYPYGKYSIQNSGTQKDVKFTGVISCDGNYVLDSSTNIGSYITCLTNVKLNIVIKNNTSLNVKALYKDFSKKSIEKIIINKECSSGEIINTSLLVDAALKGKDVTSGTDGNLFIRINITKADDINYDLSYVEFEKTDLI